MLKISFTGHRPNKLGGYQWGNKIQKEVSKEIEKVILDIIEKTKEKGRLRLDDLTNKKFGKLTVLYRDNNHIKPSG